LYLKNNRYFHYSLLIFLLSILAGCASETQNFEIIKQNNKYGVKDSQGNQIIKYSYDMIYPFDNNGFAIVNNFGGKFGVINSKNEIIVDIIYDYIDNFEDDKAQIILNGKVGYINQFYEIVTKPQ
jgi:hypothetical protein